MDDHDSIVRIATRYGLDGPGFGSQFVIILRTAARYIQQEWLLCPNYYIWPPTTKRAVLWLLAQQATFRHEQYHSTSLLEYTSHIRHTCHTYVTYTSHTRHIYVTCHIYVTSRHVSHVRHIVTYPTTERHSLQESQTQATRR
jgi:hypothetical protein